MARLFEVGNSQSIVKDTTQNRVRVLQVTQIRIAVEPVDENRAPVPVGLPGPTMVFRQPPLPVTGWVSATN